MLSHNLSITMQQKAVKQLAKAYRSLRRVKKEPLIFATTNAIKGNMFNSDSDMEDEVCDRKIRHGPM